MPKAPSRNQLATFLKTQELIRAFEELFGRVEGQSPQIDSILQSLQGIAVTIQAVRQELEELEMMSAPTDAQISSLGAQLYDLQETVDGLQMAPPAHPEVML